MIDPAYVQTLARYNAWQNSQLIDALAKVPQAILIVDRRAFFGSILKTLSHLLWGDALWMSRFDTSVPKPALGAENSTDIVQTYADWCDVRRELDAKIKAWADSLKSMQLRGNLTYYSGLMQREVSQPMSRCIMHFFNHQTHHRGQVHAMMTSAGLSAPITDLIYMPDDA